MEIRPITAEQARAVRLPVLRAGLPPDAAILDHDDDDTTHHLGAFDGGRLVGVATFFPEACPGRSEPKAWRLRGMATVPEMQRQGAGRALLLEGIRIAWSAGAQLIWCHARTSARGFYESLGFEAVGDEFEQPLSGPHYVMIKDLEDPA